MSWINYHHLLYFKEIAETGTISEASKNLSVGQSALSIQLKTLEDHLGTKLFERIGRGLKLTKDGLTTLEYAQKIDQLGKELITVLQNESAGGIINFRLGALDSVPKSLICSLTDFAYARTGCHFTINEGDLDHLLSLIENHKIDFALVDFPIKLSHNSDLICQKIFKNSICAFGSKKFLNYKNKFPKSLNDLPCIFPTHHSKLREDLETFFYRKKITPTLLGETQDTSVQKLLAIKGDGVVFLPEFSTKELVEEGKLYNLGPLPGVHSEFFLVSKKRNLSLFPIDLLKNFHG